MPEDRYGLPVTTTSSEAFAHYAEGLDRILAQRDGARALLEQATQIDQGFALAWALLGLQLRLEGDMKPGAALVDKAAELGEATTGRERSQLTLLATYCRGRFPAAQALADAHLTTWPGDALVMQHANYVFNLLSAELDRRARHNELAQRVLAANPADWYFLGEAAFAAAEVDRFDDARDYVARSFAVNPYNGEAAHAAAHVFYETGAAADGAAWLAPWLPTWNAPSAFGGHLAWHLALFTLLDRGPQAVDVTDMLAYRDRPLTLLMDAGSLFWRLRLAGVEDLPWAALAELPSAPGYSLSNFHRGFVLAALGDFDALAEWSARLRHNVAKGHPSAAVCAEVVEAIGLHAQGEFVACADRLEAVARDWPRLGGSRAQLDVLADTLLDALTRAGLKSRADAVAERRARRC